MNRIHKISALERPKYIRPVKIHYTQNGVLREWEAILSHDSVAVLLWHVNLKAFVIVRQLRATVLNQDEHNGFTYELCAGIMDKDASEAQTAKEEILEECGYEVPLESLERVTSFYTSVGISGAKQTLFFACVDETMQVNDGGGLEDEAITVLYLPIEEAKAFMFDESRHKTPGMMMAFYWFFENRMNTTRTR